MNEPTSFVPDAEGEAALFKLYFRRFRHMMTDSKAYPKTATDKELMQLLKGKTRGEKLVGMIALTSFVSEGYWRRRGL